MAIYAFEGKRPVLGEGSFVPESADIIGDVTIGRDCFIGVGARIRGDYGTVVIGDRSSVQENVVIHAREGEQTQVGNEVQVGHGAILHTCSVGDSAVIGIGAIVTDFAEVGVWAIIGEGALVRGTIADGTIAVGVPAKVVAEVTEEQKREWMHYKRLYAELASRRYPQGLERIG